MNSGDEVPEAYVPGQEVQSWRELIEHRRGTRRRENGRGIGHAAKPEPDYRDRQEKRRFRKEKGTGDIGRQDAYATICGITRPDSAPGD